MKRIILTITVLLAALAPGFAFASVVFDPTSPQVADTPITPTCSIGNTIEIYQGGAWYSEMGGTCDGVTTFTESVDGTYQVVEWNSLVQLSDPTTQSLAATMADPAFVSVSNYTFGLPSPSVPLFTMPTMISTDVAGKMSDTLADPGLLIVICSILALFTLPWLVEQIAALFPGKQKARDHSPAFEKAARRQYARRSYLNGTDDRSSRGDYLHEGQ